MNLSVKRALILSVFLVIMISACDSNEPEVERVPLGTFQVNIDGVPWEAEVAIASSFELPVFPEEDVSSRALSIGGLSLNNTGRLGRNIIIAVSNPEERTYNQDLGVNIVYFNPGPDTLILYNSVEMNLALIELTEDEVRGTFSASVAQFSIEDEGFTGSEIELTEGIFAVPIRDFPLDDSLFFPTPRF